ncbi:hypothetical protein VKI21_07470 [Cyanobacterium aponinum UTEX 3222]|uniref:hypothetical protein n=1 Tax=Cyanobacterium aponinum TaxID=379064 RepID=UPI002B4BB519|nr:hypothetical protein [Cyanobacterium aponinum]WRL37168.1 hypothetical protein VKI22_11055 [Cyanobacterium aponinum UTEX 3221]WRL43515.1 hypothetical protein VKI21_07470 [Cyanobacterium aponinum UTEX 3222]
MSEHNYWLVGASWGGVDHQDEKFVEEGYWMLGWTEEEHKAQFDRALQIQIGDRIAIKRRMGSNNPNIRILHLGIVKGVIKEANKVICTVNWVIKNLENREVESHGCYASVHGPYSEKDYDGWIREIFSL